MRNDDKVTDTTAVTIRDANNQELTDLLTLGDGPLAAGAQPAIQAENQKALSEALAGGEAKAAAEPKRRPSKGEKTEKAEPKTFEEPHTHLPKQKTKLNHKTMNSVPFCHLPENCFPIAPL